MRFRPASRVALAGASLLASWMLGDQPAQADVLVGSTLIPTSSVVTTSSYFPTSYLPTSYVSSSLLPTSYVIPTSTYLPTSSIIETGGSIYYPTTYVGRYRGGLFRPRRFVERTSYYGTSTGYLTPTAYYSSSGFVTPTTYLSSSYIPTSYVASSYLPTSYVVPTMATSSILPTTYLSSSFVTPTSYVVDNGLIATTASAAVCCDSSPGAAATPALNPTRTVAPARPSSNTITSQSTNGESSPRNNERVPSAAVSPNPADEGMTAPPAASPAVPAPPRSGESSPPPPEKAEDVPNLPPPGGMKPQLDEGAARTSYKPVNYRPTRNILRGRVISYETGRAEEAVSVVLSSRTKTFDDRATLTDADGEFKISLPDGDWAVKVTMPSGSIYTVGRSVTASGGQVVDRNGRNVGEFVITR